MQTAPVSPRGLVIFDLDGTLFRAESVTVPAVRRAFGMRGLPEPSDEEIRCFIGRPTPELHAWISSQCPADMGEEVARDVDRFEIELVTEAGELYPGALEALHELRASVAQMAICTNGPRPYVQAVLGGYSLARFFDAVRLLESDDDRKPGMVRDLLARLSARPAVVVGDRGDDVAAAHRNGLPAVAAMYGVGSREELAAADALAASPSELPRLVTELLAIQQEEEGSAPVP